MYLFLHFVGFFLILVSCLTLDPRRLLKNFHCWGINCQAYSTTPNNCVPWSFSTHHTNNQTQRRTLLNKKKKQNQFVALGVDSLALRHTLVYACK